MATEDGGPTDPSPLPHKHCAQGEDMRRLDIPVLSNSAGEDAASAQSSPNNTICSWDYVAWSKTDKDSSATKTQTEDPKARARSSPTPVWFSKSGKILAGKYGLEVNEGLERQDLAADGNIWFPKALVGEYEQSSGSTYDEDEEKVDIHPTTEAQSGVIGDDLYFPGFDGGPYHHEQSSSDGSVGANFSSSYAQNSEDCGAGSEQSSDCGDSSCGHDLGRSDPYWQREKLFETPQATPNTTKLRFMDRLKAKIAYEKGWRKMAVQDASSETVVSPDNGPRAHSALAAWPNEEQAPRESSNESDNKSNKAFLAKVDGKLQEFKDKTHKRAKSRTSGQATDGQVTPVIDTSLRPLGAGWAAEWNVKGGSKDI